MSDTKTQEVTASPSETALLEQLLAGCQQLEDLLAPGGAFKRLLGSELSVKIIT